MRKYDYSFLKNRIPGNIFRLTEVITDLKAKGEFRKLQYAETFESLRQKSVIESVKGSNAIEGIVTTDSRIKDIVEGDDPETHNEMEISGYKNALNMIYSNYGNLDVDENLILLLHKMIEEQAGSTEAGKYKTTNNFILEYDSQGNRRVRFKPVSPETVSENMEQMLLACYEAQQDAEIPPLLLIPCFILDLLCIHPFTDGNGRVSRLLTVLLLYKSGYDIVRYISFEGQINKYIESYYSALEASSDLWHENRNDYVPFIVNFLQILYRCYKDLDESFMELSLRKAKKSERVENILMGAVVPISKQEIVEKVPDISVRTVEAVLKTMVKENRIRKIGAYKYARYVRNNEYKNSPDK